MKPWWVRISTVLMAAALIAGALFTINQCFKAKDYEDYRHDQNARFIQGQPIQTFDQWKADEIRKAGE